VCGPRRLQRLDALGELREHVGRQTFRFEGLLIGQDAIMEPSMRSLNTFLIRPRAYAAAVGRYEADRRRLLRDSGL